MKRKVKKKKLKIKNIFITILFLTVIGFGIYFFTLIPVRSIYIKGNTYYTDEEILNMTKLSEKPSYIFTNSFSVNESVKKDKLIKNIELKKTLTLEFIVTVNENKVLCFDKIKNKSILSNGDRVDYRDEKTPTLINDIPNKKVYNKFVKKMSKVDDKILNIMSEIKYDPNTIDNERFLVSLSDGNYVYLTLSKFSKINEYYKIYKTLGGKNGILYLDYGNYFLSK